MFPTSTRFSLQATTSPLGSRGVYLFVTAISRHAGRLLLSRHRCRGTWETQSGHIEPGETPLQAMRRELYEEAGALDFDLVPVCDYSAKGTHGVFFFADIHSLGPLPQSEMAEVRHFDALPPELTYPGISPVLYDQVKQHFAHG